ncbi:hypothetical protein [Pseudokineococcus sp. 1T1Z-3]|uniref:hypothetical protein n=1 Tax=Pseudokineococcus sp. 1T1Z-3 TaxID=3132745 RepID=UPI0030A95F2B
MRRVVGWVVLLGVLALLAAGLWVYSRGYVAYTALRDVRDGVPAVADAVVRADPERLDAAAAEVRADARRAREATEDPLWQLAARFPWGGENLAALTTASRATDDLAQQGLGALGALVEDVDDVRDALTSGGGLDLGALRSAVTSLEAARDAFDDARAQIEGIDGEHLLPQVEAGRDELARSLDLVQQAEDLLGQVELPGAGALADLGGGRVPSLEDLRGAEGDLVPDEVERRLRELAGQLPDDVLPEGLLDRVLPGEG